MPGNGGRRQRKGEHTLLAVVCGTSTVDIESGDDLRDGVVETQHDLDMASRILRGDCNCILSSDSRDFVENAILDAPLNLLDLL